ncbi:ABC transporter ATP-binding protein [Aeromicrobium piscarium]|nr:ATP-binding cassette domain-containing protein [Aeromicrobium piscarium]
MTTQLEIDRFSAGYGRIMVCRDVQLTIERGEVVAVLGANGAGKSTFLQGLAGLNDSQGTIRLDGTSIEGLNAAARARAGLAFVPEQRGNVFPHMTVLENLAIAGGKGASGATRELIDEVFPALEKYRTRQAGLLSGGEQQMLAIAMALMSEPAMMLLDEPSQGLAPTLLRSIAASLARLKQGGITMLVAEQNRWFAGEIADRALLVGGGRLTPEE